MQSECILRAMAHHTGHMQKMELYNKGFLTPSFDFLGYFPQNLISYHTPSYAEAGIIGLEFDISSASPLYSISLRARPRCRHAHTLSDDYAHYFTPLR